MPSASRRLWRVATLNIQAGLTTHRYRDYLTKSWHHISPSSAHKKNNLLAIAQHVQHLDVLGVQEIDPGSLRSGFHNQAHVLAQHAGFEYWSCQTNRNTGFSTTANALFAKHPLHDVEHWTLPTRRSAPASRGAVCAVFNDGRRQWCCVVAHLSLHPQDRLAQAQSLAERIADKKNILLMGDFNDLPQSLSLAPLRQQMDEHTEYATYPRWEPRRAIDVLWWKGIDVVNHGVHQWGNTDHCAVDISFTVPKPQ